MIGSALALYQEQEIYRLIGCFFDRAVCDAAEAYEREASLHREGLVLSFEKTGMAQGDVSSASTPLRTDDLIGSSLPLN